MHSALDPTSTNVANGKVASRVGGILFVAFTWVVIGCFIGFIVGGSFFQIISNDFLPAIIIGFIALSFVWSFAFTLRLKRVISPTLSQTADSTLTGKRMLARVDSLKEAGLVVRGTDHLFAFTLTVFPELSAPYQTTARQFITMGELPNYYTGRFVVFVEDRNDPGYGILEKEPPEDWKERAARPLDEYADEKATKIYPDKGFHPLGSRTSFSASKLVLNIVLSLVFLVIGFIIPFLLVPNGFQSLLTTVRDIPGEISGSTQGNFTNPRLSETVVTIKKTIGDRKVQSVLVYKEYVIIIAEHPGRDKAFDRITFRGGSSTSAPYTGGSSIDPDELFSIADISEVRLQKAIESAKRQTPELQMVYAGYRMHVTKRTVNTDIHSDSFGEVAEQRKLVIDVVFDDEYDGSQTVKVEANTGKLLKEDNG